MDDWLSNEVNISNNESMHLYDPSPTTDLAFVSGEKMDIEKSPAGNERSNILVKKQKKSHVENVSKARYFFRCVILPHSLTKIFFQNMEMIRKLQGVSEKCTFS